MTSTNHYWLAHKIRLLRAREEGWRYAAAYFEDGQARVYAISPTNGEIARVAVGAFMPKEIAPLPRVLVGRACTGWGEFFYLELHFIFDPQSRRFTWDIVDEKGQPLDGGAGVTSGRGTKAWFNALRALAAQGAEFASVLQCEADYCNRPSTEGAHHFAPRRRTK